MSTLKTNTIKNTNDVEMYLAKAWVNFNGTGTVAIRAAGNVSTITDNGTGDYTVNFTNAMPDANYSTCVGGSRITTLGNDFGHQIQTWSQTTTTVRMNTPSSNAPNYDWAQINIAIFR